MFTSMLFSLVYWLIVAVREGLDGFGSIMPDQVNAVIAQIVQAIWIFDFVFPVDTLFYCLTFMITFELLLLTKSILISIINWIRGAGELKV